MTPTRASRIPRIFETPSAAKIARATPHSVNKPHITTAAFIFLQPMGPHDTDVLAAYNRRLRSSRLHLRSITILGLAMGTQYAEEIRDGHYPVRISPRHYGFHRAGLKISTVFDVPRESPLPRPGGDM
jgi:hypothetical protein